MSEGSNIRAASKNSFAIVEYTLQATSAGLTSIFSSQSSFSLVGQRPELIGIDGGAVQTEAMDLGVKIKSNSDIGYAMTSVGPGKPVQLYQVGDIMEGTTPNLSGFNNFLDALDGSYCTEEGGDNPSFNGTYPDPAPEGFQGQR
ncbi:hypothetical protein B0H13DRAFT_389749 [Mycena leptocephala]|nr:hypothetical protein B0H13DRAFT_389749 [Mycena leptocephala]